MFRTPEGKEIFAIDGPDDMAIFQSAYLRDYYKNGFNTVERNSTAAAKYPDQFTGRAVLMP